MIVAIVAIAGIVGIVLLAFVISNLGGDSTNPGGSGDDDGTTTTTSTTTRPATSAARTGTATTAPGTMPDVVGQQISDAKKALETAGYKVNQIDDPSTAAKGTVIETLPVAGGALTAGQTITVGASKGP